MRILPSADIPPHQFLYLWQNKPCFARGELVALTGKAKSGKTYVCSLLMALSDQKQVMDLHRPEDQDPYRVLWIDTEQSEDSTQEILCQRIGTLLGHEPDPEQIIAYNLRQMDWDKRLNIISLAICNHMPDLVIFDGIRDVVGDINDYQQAQTVLTKLLSIASWSNACIVCVLHQNKAVEDKTLRGALGTELQNKSYETYECEKNTDTHIFTMRQTATRKYDITAKLQFEVNDNGLPVPVAAPTTPLPTTPLPTTPLPTTPLPTTPLPTTPLPKKPSLNPAYIGTDGKIDQRKLFGYILPNSKRMSWDQLRAVVMKVMHIYSPNFADNLIAEARDGEVLTMLLDASTNTKYYELKTNEILTF